MHCSFSATGPALALGICGLSLFVPSKHGRLFVMAVASC